MSAVTAYRFLDELCLTVQFELERFAIDASWIAGASVGGLFTGGVITAIIIICFVKQIVNKKQQDEETGTVFCRRLITVTYLKDGDVLCLPSLPCLGKTGSLSNDGKRNDGKRDSPEYIESLRTDIEEETIVKTVTRETHTHEVVNIKEKETSYSSGMINILMKKNYVDIDAEMKKQDLDAVTKMEQNQEKLRDNMELKQLKMLLKKLNGKGRVSEPYIADIVQKVTDKKKRSRELLDLKRAEKEEEITKKYAKNEKELQVALESSETKYNHELKLSHKDEQEYIRKTLLITSGLSDTEVDDVMEELKQNMARLEKKRGLEQTRQARVLAERLEQRRKILDLQRLQEAQNDEALSEEVKVFHEPLKKLLSDGKITERQKNALLDQHKKDVIAIKKNHEMNAERQQQDMAEKLRQRRQERMKELAEKHEQEQLEQLNQTENKVSMDEFIESYPELVKQQQQKLEEIQTELDQTEIQQMEEVKLELEKKKNTEIKKEIKKERRKKLEQIVKSQDQLPESNIESIINLHEMRMNDLEKRQKVERDRMIAILNEKLEKRMLVLDLESQEDLTGRNTIQTQQEGVVTQLLSSIEDLSEDTRNKILLEHKRNMEKLNNELQISKMKQELSLEHKLIERRRQLAELQQKKDQEKKAKTDKEIKDFENQLEAEEKKYEEERQRALSDLRQKLEEETKAALEAQTDGLAALIGRLKAGHARRQGIIERNAKNLEKLKERSRKESTIVDRLIEENDVKMKDLETQIEYKMKEAEQRVTEKLKRRKRELDDTKFKEKMEKQKAGSSKSSQILHQIWLEQKYKKAKDELEQELKLEFECHMDQLNCELEEQKRKILIHLGAAIKTA